MERAEGRLKNTNEVPVARSLGNLPFQGRLLATLNVAACSAGRMGCTQRSGDRCQGGGSRAEHRPAVWLVGVGLHSKLLCLRSKKKAGLLLKWGPWRSCGSRRCFAKHAKTIYRPAAVHVMVLGAEP